MKKQICFTVVLLTFASLLMSACQPTGGSDTSGDRTPSPGEPEATSVTADHDSELEVLLDPALLPTAEASAYVYESLLKLEGGQTVPVLALEGTVSEDGLDYILTLRPGVSFHDGTAFNADAVITNFNRWFDPQDAFHGSGSFPAWADNFGGFKGEKAADGKPISNFDGIEKVDELTVLIHLNKPDLEFLNKLADPAFAIVSPNALAAPGFGTTAGVDGGTGPYLIGEFSADSLTLEPNPAYWNPNVIPASSIAVTP
jgi:peptide/nickel transport system substrate-binding protein